MAEIGGKLRILHLTAGSDAGGLSRYIYDLCSAMHAAGHEVAVAGERGAWHELFAEAPWPWIDVPLKGGPLRLLAAGRRLQRFLAEHPVDVIHAHYRRATLVGRFLQRRHRPPLLYTLHLSHMAVGGVRRAFTDFGDHTHVASVDARDWLVNRAGVDANRISVIPHGIHAERFPVVDEASRATARRGLNLPLDATVAAYVGRFDVPKNEQWLIDLAQRYPAGRRAPHILLVGQGPHEAELRQRIERSGLGDRVRLLPYRPPLAIYHAADALLLPSTREGFSLVCAEAMAAGIPVLRTRTSGTSELILENVTGRSTAVDREAFLAAAVEFLADVPSLRRMGEAAARHVRQHLTFQRQYERTLDLYRRLADAQA